MTEEQLSHLFAGLEVESFRLFQKDGGLQIWFQGGSMLSVYATDDGLLRIGVSGPNPPEDVQLRDQWQFDTQDANEESDTVVGESRCDECGAEFMSWMKTCPFCSLDQQQE